MRRTFSPIKKGDYTQGCASLTLGWYADGPSALIDVYSVMIDGAINHIINQ